VDNDQLHADARKALEPYALPDGSPSVHPIRATNNAVFRVDAGTARFALRVHRPNYRLPDMTRSELQFVEGLRTAACLRVPEAVRTQAGDLVSVFGTHPRRHASLLTWLDGQVRRPTRGLGPRGAYGLGETLATMHTFAESFVPPPAFSLPVWDVGGLVSEQSVFGANYAASLLLPEDRAVFEAVSEQVASLFAALGRSSHQFGIIHADFILGNCVWRGRSLRILDFDDCGWGYFLYDLAPIMDNFEDFSARMLQRAFLDGYRAVRALDRDALDVLPLLMAARHASVIVWLATLLRQGHEALDIPMHLHLRAESMRKRMRPYPSACALAIS
jgi:Ser/Thr protein kinase RdoA (MazF antagonist)